MIKTDRLWLSGVTPRVQDAGELVDEFARAAGIAPKDALRVTLLVEETVGMVRAMVDSFEAELWLEGDGASCAINLEARVRPDGQAERALPPPAGFMAKIGQLLRCGFIFENKESVPEFLRNALPDRPSCGSEECSKEEGVILDQWSLSSYKASLLAGREHSPEAREALDELEQSVVASLADDVTVGIQGESIKLVITKTFRH